MSQHVRTHHTHIEESEESVYQCSFCNYKTNRKGKLTQHLDVHSTARPFHCTYCNYKAKRKAELIKHLRIHTGEKPFYCSLCDYKCKQSYSLLCHQRNQHKIVKKQDSSMTETHSNDSGPLRVKK